MSIACSSPTKSSGRASFVRLQGWPVIDVTHRSIEETAAAVIDLYKVHQLNFIASS